MKERLNYIDYAKGISIILVVYGHAATQYQNYPVWKEYLMLSNTIIFSYVMPFFFIISASFQRRKLASDTITIKSYLLNTSQSLLLPFFSLSFVFLLLNVILHKYTNSPTASNMLYALLLEQSNSNLLPSGVLWFLFTLYMFDILTFLYAKTFKGKMLYLIFIALLLRTDLNVFSSSHFFAFDKISKFYVFYIFGFSFNLIITKSPLHKNRDLFLLLATYAIILGIHHFSEQYSAAYWLSEALSVFGLAGISLSLFVLGVSYRLAKYFKDNIATKVLSFFGMLSILVYVFHMPTFTIFRKISPLIIKNPNYLSVLILFIPGVLFPLLYGKILSSNKHIYKILLGRNPVGFV